MTRRIHTYPNGRWDLTYVTFYGRTGRHGRLIENVREVEFVAKNDLATDISESQTASTTRVWSRPIFFFLVLGF